MKRNRDLRLSLRSPATERYFLEQEKKCLCAADLFKESTWQPIIVWFCNKICAKAGLGPHPSATYVLPETIEEFIDAVRELDESLSGKQPGLPNLQSPVTSALCRCIGECLGNMFDYGFAEWKSIHTVIADYWPIYEAWKDQLQCDEIAKFKAQIIELPLHHHVLDLIDSWRLNRDKRYWDGYLEEMDVLKNTRQGVWTAVERGLQGNVDVELNTELRFRGDLIVRLGIYPWLKWVLQFPLFSMQAAALLKIDNIDEALEMTKLILLADKSELVVHPSQQALAVQIAIELLDRIDEQLAHWSSNRWAISEEDELFRQKIELQYKYWQENELPKHLHQLAEFLSQTWDPENESIIVEMLKSSYQLETGKHRIEGLLRDALVSEVGQNAHIVPCLIEHLLTDVTNPSLLNSSLFLFNSDLEKNTLFLIINRIWGAFSNLIQHPDFYWGSIHNSDDGQLAWTMAVMLANQENPKDIFIQTLGSIHVEPEGWEVNSDMYYPLQRNVVYYLIVSAMACEWLMKSTTPNIKEARSLYDEVWKQAHQWIRFTTDDIQENMTLVSELWARLSTVFQDREDIERYALDGLEQLDELGHILNAFWTLEMNFQRPGIRGDLPIFLQNAIRHKFDELFPIIRKSGHAEDGTIKWYQDTINKIGTEHEADCQPE